MQNQDANTFVPPVSIADPTLRQTIDALAKWLRSKIGTFVLSRSNAAWVGFQSNLRAYGVPAILNQAAVLAGHDAHGQWLINMGVVDVSFNSNGDGTLTYPYPFPTGTVTCLVMGNNALGTQDIMVWTTGFYANATTLRKNSGLVQTIRCNYIAIGY